MPIIDSVRVFETIDPIADEWDQLADRVRATPFVRPGWMQAWLDAFGGERLRTYTVWREDQLVGLIPMLARGSGLFSLANLETPSFAPLAEDAESSCRLIEALLAEQPRRMDFGYLATEVPASVHLVNVLRQRSYRHLRQRALRSPYTNVDIAWDVFQKRLSRNRRKGLRRRQRHLADTGVLRFAVHDGREHLDDLLAEGFAVEASGWKGRQGTAIARNANLHRFYVAVARWAADRGWLRLYFLRLDDRAIAFELALHHNGVLYDLKGGYDEQYSQWSPSLLLLAEMVQAACTDDTRVIEWLGDDEPFKLEWSDGIRERVSSTWLVPSIRGLVDYLRLTLWWELRRQSKARLPRSLIKDIRTATGRVRQMRGARRQDCEAVGRSSIP